MNVQEILDTVAFKYPHAYTDEDIIKILNRVQKVLYRKLFKPETAAVYDLLADNPFYTIDYSPQNIVEVVVKGKEYKNINITGQAERQFYYIIDGNTVGIYPTPIESVVAGLVIFHNIEPKQLTTADLLSEPGFDDVWHMLIVYHICKELSENALDPKMGDYFIGQINSLEDEYKSSTHIAPSEIQLPEWGY